MKLACVPALAEQAGGRYNGVHDGPRLCGSIVLAALYTLCGEKKVLKGLGCAGSHRITSMLIDGSGQLPHACRASVARRIRAILGAELLVRHLAVQIV